MNKHYMNKGTWVGSSLPGDVKAEKIPDHDAVVTSDLAVPVSAIKDAASTHPDPIVRLLAGKFLQEEVYGKDVTEMVTNIKP